MSPANPPNEVYLDHAATSPLNTVAQAAFTQHLNLIGNPSSLHAAGRAARRVVEESREAIAGALNCRPTEVIFTSGGTEADNLVLKGLWWSRRQADPNRDMVAVSAIEHHAVLDPLDWLVEHEGAKPFLAPVDEQGHLDLEAVRAEFEARGERITALSVMAANNEVGTLQPLTELVALGAEHGVPVHTDAVQAVGSVPIDFAELGLDAMSISSHKIGGPLGIGALIAKRELEMAPLLHGGGQERDVRSGTLDTPAIAAFAAAVTYAVERQRGHQQRVSELRDSLIAGIRAVVPDVELSGDPVHRLPGNVHLRFPGCEGDSLLMLLDAQGIACSTGSACSAGVPQASHVLLAMGCTDAQARSSLRFSLGASTTENDVAAAVAAIGPAVERARQAGATR